MVRKNDSSQNASKLVLVIVGIVVLSCLGYFATKYFSEKQQNEQNLADIQKLNDEIFQLEEKILNFEVAMEDKNMELSEKERLLQEKDLQIEALVGQLARAKKGNWAKDNQIKDFESRIIELQSFVDQYKSEVEYLKEENLALNAALDSVNTYAQTVAEEKQVLETTQANTQRELAIARRMAAVLKVGDFRFYNIRSRSREDEGIEFRRSKMDNVRVCFTVLENVMAKAGPREFFMVYENPDGTYLMNYEGGYSGKFFYKESEKEYTAKARLDYNGQSKEVCIDFIPSVDVKYQKGVQFVSVYSGGVLVGQGQFRLK